MIRFSISTVNNGYIVYDLSTNVQLYVSTFDVVLDVLKRFHNKENLEAIINDLGGVS